MTAHTHTTGVRGHGHATAAHEAGDHVTAGHEAAHDINAAHAASASVTLDIGPGRGALVIYPDERFQGREIEISRRERGARRIHTGVHERRTQSGSILNAIFGSLPAGAYDVWADADTRAATVTVPEAAVAELAIA